MKGGIIILRIGKRNIYSIGEKKEYFKKKLFCNYLTPFEKLLYRNKLRRLKKIKPKEFDVFITNDFHFYKNADTLKSRRVVILSSDDERVDVVPVYKNNKFVLLEKFTGDRMIAKTNTKKNFRVDDLYELKDFEKETKNDYLTEKDIENVRKIFFKKK